MNPGDYKIGVLGVIMHRTVLLNEAIEALNIVPDGIYVDGTFGRGGHSAEILKQLSQGKLLIVDKDPEAIAYAKSLYEHDERVVICHGSFAELDRFIEQQGWIEKLSGVLLDLGVSSPQIDDAQRGFSFLRDGPLDMRMNTTSGLDAATWLATVPEQMLAQVLRDFGEERFAKRIAKAIVKEREQQAITRTVQLAEIIAAVNPSREENKHPATRSFQALRIFLNDELVDLQKGLFHSLKGLKTGGRLVVISFHSLEDQIVKRFVREHAEGAQLPRGLPLTEAEIAQYKTLKAVGKAIRPTEAEITENPRARSAILRVAEKR